MFGDGAKWAKVPVRFAAASGVFLKHCLSIEQLVAGFMPASGHFKPLILLAIAIFAIAVTLAAIQVDSLQRSPGQRSP
jgi:hypothetical protein